MGSVTLEFDVEGDLWAAVCDAVAVVVREELTDTVLREAIADAVFAYMERKRGTMAAAVAEGAARAVYKRPAGR